MLADSGEDAIAYCDADNYASNVETAATSRPDWRARGSNSRTREIPDAGRQDHSGSLRTARRHRGPDRQDPGRRRYRRPGRTCLRGDHELNAVKAQKLDGVASPLTMADTGAIIKATGRRTRLARARRHEAARLLRPRGGRLVRFHLRRQRRRLPLQGRQLRARS